MCRTRDRIAVALAIGATAWLHRVLFGAVENSPFGMLVYHGGAALFDFATVIISAHALSGRLSSDMQQLCLASMIINFLGWIAYLAYPPPAPYNVAIVTLCYVQWARLLWIGRYDAEYHSWRALVRRADPRSLQLHFTEKHK
mgnify:CR=1 FL=1